jgi:hypothetical protein
MVNHLAVSVERFWLRGVVAGEPIGLMEDADAAWQVDPSVRADALFDLYRQEIELANAIIAATSLDGEPAAWPYEMSPERWFSDLRGVLHHVITETACHAGHLDAVREILDGRLWMA